MHIDHIDTKIRFLEEFLSQFNVSPFAFSMEFTLEMTLYHHLDLIRCNVDKTSAIKKCC